MEFNLKYRYKTGPKKGEEINAKAVANRGIQLPGGTLLQRLFAIKNLEYLGKYRDSDGVFIPYRKPRIERVVTPNGFILNHQVRP